MNVVALAAVHDPGTPTSVLTAVADTYEPDDAGPALLVHPHMPTTTVYPLSSMLQLTNALASPALSPQTRRRVLAAATTGALLEAVRSRSSSPDVTCELSTRLETEDGPLASGVACSLFDHAHLDVDARLAALCIAVSDATAAPLYRGSYVTHALVTAAANHPTHLHDVAALAADPTLQHLLQGLLDVQASGHDPLVFLRQEARRTTHPHATGDLHAARRAAVEAIQTCPDAALADELLTAHPTWDELASIVVSQPALIGTDVFYRAWEGRHGNRAPTPLTPTSTNLALIDATASCSLPAIQDTSCQPLTTDPQILVHGYTALSRVPKGLSAAFDWMTADHLARICAHPATPDATRKDAARRLRTMTRKGYTHGDGPFDGWLPLAQIIADLPTSPRARLAALAASPLSALNADAGETISASIAAHLSPLLHTLPPHVYATAIRLEPMFTGTVSDLLTTAATITT